MKSLVPIEVIEKKILLIDGRKVILDKDLAGLYGVSTGNLNKAVNRNKERFPEDFMVQLSLVEFSNLKSHFGTSSWGGMRKPPRAFTEQGIAQSLRSHFATSRSCGDRFPEDFMFQITDQEFINLKSQIVISSWDGSRRATPYL